MKHRLNKSLLVLACAIGLTVTPQVQSLPAIATIQNAGAALVAYEIASLLRMTKRGSKPDFKQRAFLDMSRKLLKEDIKQWAKNVLKNIEIAQTDYIEGQTFKGQGLSVDPEGKVISGQKCLSAGFNGNLLGWLGAISKSSKSAKDVALFFFTIKAMQSSRLMKYLGWENPYDKKNNSGNSGITINIDLSRLSDDQIATLTQFMQSCANPATDTGAGAEDTGVAL